MNSFCQVFTHKRNINVSDKGQSPLPDIPDLQFIGISGSSLTANWLLEMELNSSGSLQSEQTRHCMVSVMLVSVISEYEYQRYRFLPNNFGYIKLNQS